MKLLVTGREGQVARALSFCTSADIEVVCVGRPELDLGDRVSIDKALAQHQPDVVVNCAAYTAVDKAETDPDTAFMVNRDGAGHVAEATAEIGVPVVHLSTDYVFDGDKAEPYTEADTPDPQTVYGASKLAGERAVAAANPAHVILRTAWVYAPWGHNFPETMLRLAGNQEIIRVVADQHGTPTYAPDIASGIVKVAETMNAAPSSEAWRGVFHMTNAGATTWAGFAEELFRQSKAQGGAWARVERIGTLDYPTAAKRPHNSRLDATYFQRVFQHTFGDWPDGVGRMLIGLSASQSLRQK